MGLNGISPIYSIKSLPNINSLVRNPNSDGSSNQSNGRMGTKQFKEQMTLQKLMTRQSILDKINFEERAPFDNLAKVYQTR